jgi:hypothetical protein
VVLKMDRLAWEQHAQRHHELLLKAESNQLRKLAVERMWRLRRDRAVGLLRRMMTVFHKGRFGRYNRPSAAIPAQRVVRCVHSTTEF